MRQANQNQRRERKINLETGDKVKTVYGTIETVMVVEPIRIITYESARENSWYHPTKIIKKVN